MSAFATVVAFADSHIYSIVPGNGWIVVGTVATLQILVDA